MNQLPPPGDYKAKVNGQILIGLARTGALCITIPCVIAEGDHAGFQTEWLGVIFKKDETPMQNTIDNLRSVFGPAGWDGVDFFWLTETAGPGSKWREFPETEFVLAQCIHEEYEDKTRFKAGFLNATASRIQLAPISRDELMKRYGSRLRATAGGTPVPKTKGAPTPHDTTKEKKAPGKKSAPVEKVSTMEECWAAMDAANPSFDQAALEKAWFALLTKEIKTTDYEKVSGAQWGSLLEKINDNVPM